MKTDSNDSIEQNFSMTEKTKILKSPQSLAWRSSGNDNLPSYRSPFMKDRDRILTSKSFRRLSGKTQVFLTGQDDHKRTRLTHTLEVSQIARTISRNLGLDEDLTEAISLGHDIGHTPFGHSGERTLHSIMQYCENHVIPGCPFDLSSFIVQQQDVEGFKHNFHSVRTAVDIEKYYGRKGLDLTNFTLFGMLNHSSLCYKGDKDFGRLEHYNKYRNMFSHKDNPNNPAWTFEAFVVAIADEIAQKNHDIEDALRGKLVTIKEITSLFKKSFKQYLTPVDKAKLKEIESAYEESVASHFSSLIVNFLVTRLLDNSRKNMSRLVEIYNLDESTFETFIIKHNFLEPEIRDTISFMDTKNPDGFLKNYKIFSSDVSDRVLSSYQIQKMDAKAKYIITKMFQAYYNTPEQLPDHAIKEFLISTKVYGSYEKMQSVTREKGIGYLRKRFLEQVKKVNPTDDNYAEFRILLMRTICDHIAGMTDAYANTTYSELYG